MVAAVLVARPALAGSWAATLEPGYGHVETDSTPAGGPTSHTTSDSLLQRYRLSLDLPLTEFLSASAGGSFLDTQEWRVTDGRSDTLHGDTSTFYGRLSLAAPTLNGGIGVDRTQQRILTSPVPTQITESYTGFLLWRPLQLPELELRAGHVNAYDVTRRLRDFSNDSASAGLRYQAPNYDLRYVLSWLRSDDHVNDSRTGTVEQDLLGTRTDTLFGGRTATYVSGSLQARTTSNEARGANATFTRQQLAVAGFSGIESGAAPPEHITLNPNPKLIDGDRTKSADVDVGYTAGLRDPNPREVGAQFADLTTEVNTIYVWIDDPLIPEVGAALTAATSIHVFQSRDNETWTEIIPASASPSPFENRLEITIPETAARYLKVTLKPLDVTVTSNTEYSDTFVTEVQFLLVTPASQVARRQSTVAATANGFARTIIVRSYDFAHDVSVTLARDTDTDLTRWTMVNGLSAQHGLWRTVTANGRVARQDQDLGDGHEGLWQWNAGLVGRPLPTAYWSVIYSGNAQMRRATDDEGAPERLELAHSLSALGRADLYDGISGQLNGSVTTATRGTRVGQSGQASGSIALTPNRWVTITAGALFSRTRTTDSADGSAVVQEFGRVDGSLSLTPAPALSATGTLSRVLVGVRPTTLGTLQLNYFPLRGDLQLSVGYSRIFDTATAAMTEVLTPMLRWNVRRGVSLTGSYSLLKNESPVSVLETRALLITLLITL